MKIGVLGGTFDPPHYGHLAIARAAIEALGLDEVVFMPVSRNPMKRKSKMTTAKHRLEMTRLLIQGEPKMAVSDLEVTRGGPSYSVDTMSELQMAQPAEYWFLVGADALADLPHWKQPDRFVRLCRVGAVSRGRRDAEAVLARLPEELKGHIDIVPMPMSEISASELRDLLGRKQSISRWTPPAVVAYLESNKLYENL